MAISANRRVDTDRSFDLAQLKAVPIQLIAADLGFVLSQRGSGRCILPGHEDKNPSFQLRLASNTFRCYACDGRGSTIDLVMQVRDVSFTDACRWIENRYTNGRTAPATAPRRAIAMAQPSAARPDRQIDQSIYRWLLQKSPLLPDGREYLRGRKIPDRTIAKFAIGQIPGENLLPAAKREFGLERLLRAGLVVEGLHGLRIVFPRRFLLFPFFEKGEVVYLQTRANFDNAKRRWVCLDGLHPSLYNCDVIEGRSKTIWLCEGITDVLSADVLKKPAVGLLGAHAELVPDKVRALARKDVVVISDADKAGTQFRRRITRILSDLGATVGSKTLPAGCNDLNEYLIKKARIR